MEKAALSVMFKKSDVVSIFVLVLVFGQTECAGAALGIACNTTADCNKTTTATAVCDVLATPRVCKIQNTGNCSMNASMCVNNATCTNNTCVCSTKYKESTADKLCAAVLGSECTAIADCNTVANSNCTGSGTKTCICNTGYTRLGADCKAVLGSECTTIAHCNTVAYSNCTGSGTKTCTCNTGYTMLGADCKADLGSVCTATSDCSLVTTTDAVCELNATQKICFVGSGGNCSGTASTKCITHSTCTSNVCTCDTGYAATAEKLCSPASGAEGLINMMRFALTLTGVFTVKIF